MMCKISRFHLSKEPLQYSTVALILFVLSILLPQGVGFRLPGGLPNLDLPRLAVLVLLGLFFLKGLSSGRISINGAPRTLTLLFLLSVWQFISALVAESPSEAMIWAVGNTCNFWLFAFAIISLAGHKIKHHQVAKAFATAGIILAVWSIVELITQKKIFALRNIWAESELQLFSTTLRRVYPSLGIELPLMSIGPFATNHALSGALCALGGFLIFYQCKLGKRCWITTVIFILAIMATQSRTGIIAATLMILISIIWDKSGMKRFLPLIIVTAMFLIAIVWLDLEQIIAYSFRFSDFTGEKESVGTVAARAFGLQLLFEQIDKWWLFGAGPGSLFDSDRVISSIKIYSDPGSFFAFFVESGLPAGLMLSWLILTSIVDGIRSADLFTRAATIGIIGFSVTALVSLNPFGWGITLVLAGMVESWSKGPCPKNS